MADDISTEPQVVNIKHYGGDTLTVKITVPAGYADGLDWDAQVRSVRNAATVDATFLIQQPAAPGDPGYITLLAAECARLIGMGTTRKERAPDGSLRSIQSYAGVYDCQVSDAGLDPVKTLVQGDLLLSMDVTRLAGP